MSYYIAFEAGSRAGLSTELFFRAWRKQNHWKDCDGDVLVLADSSPAYYQLSPSSKSICRVAEYDGIKMATALDEFIIFPADELTRQCNERIRYVAGRSKWSAVHPLWYDKTHVNNVLYEAVDGSGCNIRVPLTFGLSDVCVKPVKASAGSKGIELKSDVCVSQAISIKHEYVIDVLRSENEIKLFPREVQLRCGYDKMIMLMEPDCQLSHEVRGFIEAAGSFSLFAPGLFHLQIAEDENGDLFYIESSRRISGTSIVNLCNGFNPFCFMNGVEAHVPVSKFEYCRWYRYEDFILDIENQIKSIV